jgi:hypothetical protein
MISRLNQDRLEEKDFEIRDIIFKNTLPDEPNTIYDYLHKHYKPRKTSSEDVLLSSAREKCQIKKLEF